MADEIKQPIQSLYGHPLQDKDLRDNLEEKIKELDIFATKEELDNKYAQKTSSVYKHELAFHMDADTHYKISVYNLSSSPIDTEHNFTIEDIIKLIPFPINYTAFVYNSDTNEYENVEGTFNTAEDLIATGATSFVFDTVTSLATEIDKKADKTDLNNYYTKDETNDLIGSLLDAIHTEAETIINS